MKRFRIVPSTVALVAALTLGLGGCAMQSGSDSTLPEVPASGAPVSPASGTRADPHDPDTTITGTTLDVVVGPALWAVDDSAITGLSSNNEAAPDGRAYVVIPITVTYTKELAPGTVPTLLVDYESEDGQVTSPVDDDQPVIWIGDELNPFDSSVRDIEVGETVSGHVIFLVDEANLAAGGFIRVGMLFGSSGEYQYVTVQREG